MTPSPHIRAAATVGLCFVLASVMLGTTMPTAIYATYEHEFGFSLLTVTVVYAAYAVGVIAALIGFGKWSDVLGRRPLLAAGLVVAGLSDVVFLLADSTGWLLAGRVLSGVSAGIFVGTASVSITEMAPPRLAAKAPLLATIANIGGLGIGPVLAAMLVTWAPEATRTTYWVHLALAVVAVVVVALIPEMRGRRPDERLGVMPMAVPDQVRVHFIRASLLGFAGFSVLGLFTAVAPTIATQITGIHSTLGSVLMVFSAFAGSIIGQIAARSMLDRVAERLAITLFVISMVLLAVTFLVGAPALLALSGVVGGLGQGMSFAKGMSVITANAPADHRAAVTSAFFVVVYVAIAAPVIAEGLLARFWKFRGAGIVFAMLVAILAVVAGVLGERDARTASPSSVGTV